MEAQVNHSVSTVRDFVCFKHNIPVELFNSKNRNQDAREARIWFAILTKEQRMKDVAPVFNRSYDWTNGLRCKCKHYLKFDKDIQGKYERYKRELINFEIQ